MEWSEQVSHSLQYLVPSDLSACRDGSYQQWQYSTNAYINQLNPAATRQPVLRSAGLDDNRDGKMDRLEVSVQLPLQAGESVSSFSALLYHDVQLSQRAKLLFDAVTFVNYESATPMGKLSVDGDMLLRQTWPLWDYGGYRRLYADDPLFDVTDTTAAQDVAISAVMRRYNARNVSMVLRTNYASVDRRDDLVDFSDGTLKYFNASLTLRVPLQSIVYTPPASAVLKFAWIQYVSFFVLVSFLLFSLNSFIYRHQVSHRPFIACLTSR